MSSKTFSHTFWRFSTRNKIGHDLGTFLTSQKIVRSSSRGQSIFEDLQASKPRPRTWPSRPRTTSCVLEDDFEAKDVLKDSTSACYAPLSHSTTDRRIVFGINGKLSKAFHVDVGLRQGCVLSTLFFIVYINWIDKCSQADECATIGNCKISRLLFSWWFGSAFFHRIWLPTRIK